MHDLIDTFVDRGSAELVREFTFRFPVQIIAEILGVPHEDHERFHDMAVWVVNMRREPRARHQGVAGPASRSIGSPSLVRRVSARRLTPSCMSRCLV